MFARAALLKEAKSLSKQQKLTLIATYLNSMEKKGRKWSVEGNDIISNSRGSLTKAETYQAEHHLADKQLFEAIQKEVQNKKHPAGVALTSFANYVDLTTNRGKFPNIQHVISYTEFSRDFETLLVCALDADKIVKYQGHCLNQNALDIAKAGVVKGQVPAPTSSPPSKLEIKNEFNDSKFYYEQAKKFNKHSVARKEQEATAKKTATIITMSSPSPSATKVMPVKDSPLDTPEFREFCERLGNIPDAVLPVHIKRSAHPDERNIESSNYILRPANTAKNFPDKIIFALTVKDPANFDKLDHMLIEYDPSTGRLYNIDAHAQRNESHIVENFERLFENIATAKQKMKIGSEPSKLFPQLNYSLTTSLYSSQPRPTHMKLFDNEKKAGTVNVSFESSAPTKRG